MMTSSMNKQLKRRYTLFAYTEPASFAPKCKDSGRVQLSFSQFLLSCRLSDGLHILNKGVFDRDGRIESTLEALRYSYLHFC